MRRLADLARALNFRSRAQRTLPPLALLTDRDRLADPLGAARRLPAGSLVVLRHYGDPERVLLAGRLAKVCRARRLVLVVAGDLGLAIRLRAGLHLAEGLARTASPRLRLWHRRGGGLLTVAAHSAAALQRARRLGADAALLSPVFPTVSHPEAAGLGPLAFRRLCRGAGLPVYALGGVSVTTVRRLAGSGAVGIATIGGLA
jgi:thiamine-phosphate pyrophosphorylase